MKKIFIFLILAILLTSCGKDSESITGIESSNKGNLADKGVIGDDIPITRSEAVRIVALSFMNQSEIDKVDVENSFKDINGDPNIGYIYACLKLGYVQNDSKFRPDDYLTIMEAQGILDSISKGSITLKYGEGTEKNPISYALFVKSFTTMLEKEDLISENNINFKNLVVLATKENNEKLGDNIITDFGLYRNSYIDFSKYLNSQIKTLVRDNEIICVLETSENQPKLENVYVLKTEGNVITIFIGGLTRQYIAKENFDKDYTGFLCDIQIEGDKVLDLKIHENYVQEEIKLIDIESTGADNKYIEVGMDKKLLFKDYFQLKVYRGYDGKVAWGEATDIVVGDDNARLYLDDENKIVGCVLVEAPQRENIRVLINTSKFASKYHKVVEVTSKEDMIVNVGDIEKTIKANEIYRMENLEKRVIITPTNGGELVLKNVTRHNGDASFEGKLEIKKFNSGYMVVNVIEIEEYLQRVVPSEMPSTYHKEALKAQAVTARSFAMKTLVQTSYKKFGANLDDSTSSQVYNNVDESEDVNSAIAETEGVVITFDGEPVSTNFYSTSSGYGASSGDVWGDLKNKVFPTYSPEYLSAKPLVSKKNVPSLEKEEDVKKFLKSKEIKAVDSNYPWFRWEIYMSSQDLANSINNNIASRYEVNPFMILTKVGDEYVEKPITSIGSVKDINVISRGDGGILTEIEIVGSEKTVRISGEYNIRFILKPVSYDSKRGDISITRQDGKTVDNYSLLPSAFFVFDKVYDDNKNLKGINIYGGGNGHGVGMSQNGAEELAKHDVSYEKILKYFYSGIEVEKY